MNTVDIDKIVTADTRVNPAKVGLPWKESLWGCFDDMKTCCCGFWCLPCLFGLNVEKIDDSSCVGWCFLYCVATHWCLCWVPHMVKRKKLREKYSLAKEPCDDCLVAAFCAPCAMCQEARELEARAGPRRSNVMPVRVQPQPAYRK